MNESINLTAIYIADGFGAFLAMIMLGARIWSRNRNGMEVRLFRMMLYTAMISCLSDILVFMFDGTEGIFFTILIFIGNTWLFVSNILLGSLWIMTVVAHISGKGLPLNQKILIYILNIIGGGVLVINIFYPIVFSVDEHNVYRRGPLFWLYIVIEMVIMVDSIIVYVLYRKKCPEAKHFPVWQFFIPLLSGVIIQSCVYGISLICPSLSIAICGVILGLFSENEEENEMLRQNEMKSKIIIEQQKELETALSMAESANRSKTTFLNNMSHDIRTPMNAIIGYTGLAQKHIDNKEEIIDYLGKIENSSEYLLSLINEVLDMSRIESGKMTLSEHPENIRNIISSVTNIIQVDIQEKKHKLNVNIEGLTNESVICDKLRIKQILVNILSNSIKYTPKGGEISFEVVQSKGTKEDHALYEFCISDNGIGMDEEYIAIIFEPFTRVNSSTVSGIQGTGLGMAITKKLIDMMGGTIKVDSKPNEGTTIRVAFELGISGEEVCCDEVSDKDCSDKGFDCNGKKVLLVEDNELNSEIASVIFEENGLKVDIASDGDIAVEIMKNSKNNDYDYILMDIQMPRMNGYEATKLIRAAEPEGSHIPIIAMTANAFEEDKKLALEAGMDDFLTKPVKFEELFKIMSHFADAGGRDI